MLQKGGIVLVSASLLEHVVIYTANVVLSLQVLFKHSKQPLFYDTICRVGPYEAKNAA